VTDPAANQQRYPDVSRQSTGGVDGRDHRITRQHHNIHRRRLDGKVIQRQPLAQAVGRRQRGLRQGWEMLSHTRSFHAIASIKDVRHSINRRPQRRVINGNRSVNDPTIAKTIGLRLISSP
jgi:hypothetical protein